MDKQTINQTIRKMYVLNESMEELEVSQKNKELYFSVLEKYGSWQKALKLNGIGKRNLKERQRFILYCIMKNRLENFGEEVLRPKNIDEETKLKITEVYASIKELTKDVLKNWNKERVMYELRLYLLTGGKPNGIESNNPELFHQIKVFYKTYEKAMEEYEDRFGTKFQEDEAVSIDEIKKVTEPPKTVPKEVSPKKREKSAETELFKLDDLVRMGYLTEKQAEEIKLSQRVSEEEMFDFLMDELVTARVEQTQLTEERLKVRNGAMYQAVINRFGNLNKALREAVKKQVSFL